MDAARRSMLAILATLCALTVLLALGVAPGFAADQHDYLFQFDEVPSVGPHGEAIAKPGPLTRSKAMTVDGGEVYVAEGQSESRLDKFNVATGAFIGQFPQLPPPLEYIDQGVAVGHAKGETQVYVGADELREGAPHGVVTVYNAAGALQQEWTGKETASGGFGCFECGGTGDVAVDDSTGLLEDWAAGDVYVADPLHNVVDVLPPETGAGEKKPVAELMGISPGQPFEHPSQVAVSPVSGEVVVADQHGVYIFKPAAIVGQYELAGKLNLPAGAEISQGKLTVGADGAIYVVVSNGVLEFNANGELDGQVTPATAPNESWGEGLRPSVVAVDPESQRVYVATAEGPGAAPVFAFGPNIVVPDALAGPASGVGPSGATLNGTVDLDQAGPASCQFEWGTTTALGEVARCAKVEGEGEVPVSAQLSGLLPGTTYYYRLRASNANGTSPESQLRQFTTLGPRLVEASASDIASTSASLNATIDPDGDATSYYFQYGTSTGYGAQVPAAPAQLGASAVALAIHWHVQGLVAGTVYHYRLVMVSEVEVEPNVLERLEFPEADHTFTTQVAGGGLVLPDGRQWELVSQPDKHGAIISQISEAAVDKASAAGGMMTYVATIPTEDEVQGSAPGAGEIQVLSTRGAEGWSSRDIALPHAEPTGPSIGHGREYRMFSEDLSLGLVEPFGPYTSMGSEASPADTERTLYLRHDLTCTTSPSSCYEPLLTGAPGEADVPAGTAFGGGAQNQLGPVSADDATPDLAHVVLTTEVALTATGGNLYEWSADVPPSERLQSIAVLPKSEGGGAVDHAELDSADTRHAISADGSRVVWADTTSFHSLYLRDMTSEETVRLDAIQGGAGTGEDKPEFQLASSDDARVFFTDTERLTASSKAGLGGAELYECEIVHNPGGLGCTLTDLTPGNGSSADVRGGLLGASEDGEYLYFVAGGVLGSGESIRHEKAVAGGDNLYELHYDSSAGKWEAPQLIGVLSEEDAPDWAASLEQQPTRVSQSGRYLAFMSNQALTGYDNHDASSGKADEEIFLFDSIQDRLVCASCNPTGALPQGVELQPGSLGRLVAGNSAWPPTAWLAANIPGWTPYSDGIANYQSRYLSDSGRLFFNSSDALVPQDINGKEDVYEYEPSGVGDCAPSSTTFGEASGGCDSLITSGTSSAESAFLDASEDGNEVFFLTTERLVPQDVDTAYDVYDAHACTSSSPCYAAPVASPQCVTADACRAAPTPQPAAFGAPASSTFSGAGNVAPASSPGTGVQSKALPRSQQLARALAACRKRDRSAGGKRVACERQARKRYGPVRSRKAGNTKKRGGGR